MSTEPKHKTRQFRKFTRKVCYAGYLFATGAIKRDEFNLRMKEFAATAILIGF